MKLFYLLLALVFPISSFAASGSGSVTDAIAVGSSPGATVGHFQPNTFMSMSRLTDGSSPQVFSIYAAAVSTLTAGNVYPFYKNGVIYQVTSGKKAYCFNFSAVDIVSSNHGIQLLSATATFANNATTGSLTGAVYQGGVAGNYVWLASSGGQTGADTPLPGTYTFGASTFPGYQWQNGTFNSSVHGLCYEQ